MIRQLVNAYRAAGVDTVIVVTGVQAEHVKKELAGTGVRFVHDPNYASSQMLDSAKLGMIECRKTCERIFVSPVCIPPFSAARVEQMMRSHAEVCLPVNDGLGGHPVLLGARAVEHLIGYEGPDGIRGGLKEMEESIERLEIHEEGISHRLTTPEEYEAALKRKRDSRFHQRVYVRLAGEDFFFGPGPQQLLLSIQSRGSVSGACEAMGISYSKGRGMIRQMEQVLGFRLVDRMQGGPNGGSARLTEKGEIFLEIYARYEQAVADYAAEIFEDYFGELEELRNASHPD